MVNKDNNVKFSVLLPVYRYDNAEFFREAIDSIIKQTIKADEIIIYRDGELTDELYNVIDEYQKKYKGVIKSIGTKKNFGLGIALRDGLLMCKNEVVFRMDSDDISVKNRFEKQLRVMIKNNYDVVGSNIIEYDETMSVHNGVRIVPENNQDIIGFSKKRNPINHMTVCFKKSKVLESGNYMEMSGFEDYYLWVRMISNGCVFYNIQEPLVLVRGGSGMIKRRGGCKYFRDMVTFEKTLRSMRFISLTRYLYNVIIRSIVILTPSWLRLVTYKTFMRGKG